MFSIYVYVIYFETVEYVTYANENEVFLDPCMYFMNRIVTFFLSAKRHKFITNFVSIKTFFF